MKTRDETLEAAILEVVILEVAIPRLINIDAKIIGIC